MENKLNYSDKIIEPFAIKTIEASYDSMYGDFCWNQKADDFDFIHRSFGIALEVSVIITKNTQTVLAYQNSFHKDHTTIKQANIDEKGELRSWYGGSVGELRQMIIERINIKNTKANKHFRSEIKDCQLCLCIDDGGWFEHVWEFDFLKSIELNKNVVYSKIFIITSSLFLVYENGEITSYTRNIG